MAVLPHQCYQLGLCPSPLNKQRTYSTHCKNRIKITIIEIIFLLERDNVELNGVLMFVCYQLASSIGKQCKKNKSPVVKLLLLANSVSYQLLLQSMEIYTVLSPLFIYSCFRLKKMHLKKLN